MIRVDVGVRVRVSNILGSVRIGSVRVYGHKMCQGSSTAGQN